MWFAQTRASTILSGALSNIEGILHNCGLNVKHILLSFERFK